MKEELNTYRFLENYREKKLLSIQSAPQWPVNCKHVSDEVTLNFSDGSQLVVSSTFANTDIFFSIEEDVVFDIKEEFGHKPFCNIGDTQITTIFVDERVSSIKVYFDEISYVNKNISDKILVYPIGLFVRTSSRSIGICRDYLEATWLDADFSNAGESLLYSLDSRWGVYEDVDSFIVKRLSEDFVSGKNTIIDERQFS